jgi:hypothetical protein
MGNWLKKLLKGEQKTPHRLVVGDLFTYGSGAFYYQVVALSGSDVAVCCHTGGCFGNWKTVTIARDAHGQVYLHQTG